VAEARPSGCPGGHRSHRRTAGACGVSRSDRLCCALGIRLTWRIHAGADRPIRVDPRVPRYSTLWRRLGPFWLMTSLLPGMLPLTPLDMSRSLLSHRRSVALLLAALAPAWAFGCGASSPGDVGTIEPVPGAPPRFEPPPTWGRLSPGDTLPGSGCLSPMRDPRDGTEIRLIRSERGVGVYRAPAGVYGLTGTQLLRLNCNTGEPLGVARK
jgi:hypothetical protein